VAQDRFKAFIEQVSRRISSGRRLIEQVVELRSPSETNARSVLMTSTVPFAELTCAITGACEAVGLGRTKLYKLIDEGRPAAITIGRRRLVVVRSLLKLLETAT
jgi:excisionase family DNA binding protein